MNQSNQHQQQQQQNEERINSAYEALEKMRKMNLELQCNQHNLPYDDECCTTCLLSGQTARFPRLSKWAHQLQEEKEEESSNSTSRFPRLHQFVHSDRKRPKSPPCLICGTHVCKQHASKDFSKEGLTVCLECEHLFGLQFVIDFLTEPKPRDIRKHLDRLLDRYDRVLLLLKYSSQYIPDIAEQLEQSQQRQNQIGVGTSGVGLLSGALGMAAAATILTPVGPPLLVASLLFGGGSTAVQTGSQAIHSYYSEPQQLAKRIIACHSMLWSILQITSVLRDAMMREHVRAEFYTEDHLKHRSDSKLYQALDRTKGVGITAAGMTTLGRYSTVGAAEMSQAGNQSARLVTRSSTNLLRGARLARFAGGAMSAAVFVLEAKNLKDTVEAIQAGNPCEQATRLREIQTQLDKDIPETSTLDRELHRYLDILNQREKVWTEEQVVNIIAEQNNSACCEEKELEQLRPEQTPEEGDLIVSGDDSSSTSTSKNSDKLSLSLLQRIELFKQQQEMKTRGIDECAPTECQTAKDTSDGCGHDHPTQ